MIYNRNGVLRPLRIQCDSAAICRSQILHRSLIGIRSTSAVCFRVPIGEHITSLLKSIGSQILRGIISMRAGSG